MEVIRETLWKRCLSTPIKPPAKNCNICLSETAYQHKGTRKECKKTNQAAIIQWQRQCLMDKPHRKNRKPWPKSKRSDIQAESQSTASHLFLGRARFTAQPLSALVSIYSKSAPGMRTYIFAKQCDTSNKVITNSKRAGTLWKASGFWYSQWGLKLFNSKSFVV